MIFEAHITYDAATGDPGALAWALSCQPNMWKQSRIDGDPVLGPGVNAYLTAHGHQFERVLSATKSMANMLRHRGVSVKREKIELIMYDTKTGEGA